jgi:hypothetical protein
MSDEQQSPEGESRPNKDTTSPIRPRHPNPPQADPKPRTRPIKPRPKTGHLDDPGSWMDADSNDISLDGAAAAIASLRQKMQEVAQEYAEGKINEATFNAVYRRYSEQREITERLVERNPDSDVWQSVVQAGHTAFLRDYYAAKIISYALYHLKDGHQIALQGAVQLPHAQLMPIFARVNDIIQKGHKLGAAWRQLKDQNWVLMMPGKYSASVVIFSLEPSVVQRKMVEDAHRDFERANERALIRGDLAPQSLVFPHRALLED